MPAIRVQIQAASYRKTRWEIAPKDSLELEN